MFLFVLESIYILFFFFLNDDICVQPVLFVLFSFVVVSIKHFYFTVNEKGHFILAESSWHIKTKVMCHIIGSC